MNRNVEEQTKVINEMCIGENFSHWRSLYKLAQKLFKFQIYIWFQNIIAFRREKQPFRFLFESFRVLAFQIFQRKLIGLSLEEFCG